MPKFKKKSSEEEDNDTTTPIIKPACKSPAKLPFSFTCSSGELLWGHLQCLTMGHATPNHHDSRLGPHTTATTGTIIQRTHSYRACCRKGRWVVRKVQESSAEGFHVGFVVCHEQVDAQKEVLDKCCQVGMAGGGEVVYVNRYDWSHAMGSADVVGQELKKYALRGKTPLKKSGDEDWNGTEQETQGYEEFVDGLLGCRFMLVDVDGYDDLMHMFAQRKYLEVGEVCQFKKATGEVFGMHVSMVETEYELGWLVFSGGKHEDFPEEDEVIGFVYDGSYTGLEEGTYTVL